jgi:hypothetical protein
VQWMSRFMSETSMNRSVMQTRVHTSHAFG